jgi:tetratricopeptide (TPR) repeat protein
VEARVTATVPATTAMVLRDAPAGRAVFSLEMSRDGVLLRLDAAALADVLVVRDLVLRVPHVRYPFDCSAGPRALQSHLAEVRSVVVDLRLDAVARRLAAAGDLSVESLAGCGRCVVASGSLEGEPFTCRLDAAPGWGDADVVLVPREPRAFGPTRSAWSAIPRLLAALVPGPLACREGGGLGLRVLKPVLGALMAPLGFKVPSTRHVRLASVEAGPRAIRLTYGPGGPEAPAAVAAAPFAGDAETEAFEALDALGALAAADDAGQTDRFLAAGVAVPRLWPEVLARARVAGDERPERVLPHLAGVVVASRMNDVPAADLERMARRLVAALQGEEEATDARLAGRLVASLSDRLPPVAALALASEVRSRCPAEADAMLAAARALDRLGRPAEAGPLRLRALTLAPGTAAVATIRREVRSLDDLGLRERASAFLEEAAAAAGDGRLGQDGAAVRSSAWLELASREATDPAGRERGRERLRRLLASDPCDPDALDLLVALAEDDRDVAEAAGLLRAAAQREAGPARARHLLAAGRLLGDRLSLKRQAAEALEAAFEADPSDPEVAEALDAVLAGLRLPEPRFALATERLRTATGAADRAALLAVAVAAAEAAGAPAAARVHADEWVRIEPTSREALGRARRVFEAAGDREALARVLGSLADLATSEPERRAIEADLRALGPFGEPSAVSGRRPPSDLDAFVDRLELAVARDPDDATARADLAALYRATGREGAAAAIEGAG